MGSLLLGGGGGGVVARCRSPEGLGDGALFGGVAVLSRYVVDIGEAAGRCAIRRGSCESFYLGCGAGVVFSELEEIHHTSHMAGAPNRVTGHTPACAGTEQAIVCSEASGCELGHGPPAQRDI